MAGIVAHCAAVVACGVGCHVGVLHGVCVERLSAGIAAYEKLGTDARSARFIGRDFNRLWHDDLLRADCQSVEATRAHQMRPLVKTVDRLLDLHSTWRALQPFFVLS